MTSSEKSVKNAQKAAFLYILSLQMNKDQFEKRHNGQSEKPFDTFQWGQRLLLPSQPINTPTLKICVWLKNLAQNAFAFDLDLLVYDLKIKKV